VQRAIGRYRNHRLQDQGQDPLIGVLLKTPPSSPCISSQQCGVDFIEHEPTFEDPQYQDLGVTLQNEQTRRLYMNFEPETTSFPFHHPDLTVPIFNGHPAIELHATHEMFLPGILAADPIIWPASRRDLLLTDIPWVQAVDELFSTPGLINLIRSLMDRISQALDQTSSGGSYSNISSSHILCGFPNRLLSDSASSNGIMTDASLPDRIFLSLIYQVSNNKLNTEDLQRLLKLFKDADPAGTVSACLRWLFDNRSASAKQIAFEIFNQAVRSGDAEFVHKLIHLGADVEPLQHKRGGNLLTQAILHNHLDMAHLLLDNDADPNCEDEGEHCGAIRILVAWNNWSLSEKRTILRRLVDKGANINGENQDALDVAIFWKNDIRLLNMLLENGANPQYVDCEEEEISHESTPPSDDIIRILMNHFGPKWGWLRLRGIILAARDSFDSVRNFLVNFKISGTEEWQLLAQALNVCVDETSYWGRISPEIWTSESECSDSEESLCSFNSDSPYNEIGLRDRTTDRSAIKNLLTSGADPNYVPKEPRGWLLPPRRSTLLYAIQSHSQQDRTWKINILFKHGADFTKPGLLQIAASYGDFDLFQRMLKALTNFKDVDVPTILVTVFCNFKRRSRVKAFDLLRDAGMDALRSINDNTKLGMTPLQHACEIGKIEVVKELISLGAEVNGRLTTDGKLSALHIAVEKCNPLLVELLLERGARVNEWPELPGKNLFEAWASSSATGCLEKFSEKETGLEHIFDLLVKNRAEAVFHTTGIEKNWGSCFATLLCNGVPESFARRIADRGVNIDCADHIGPNGYGTLFESVMAVYSLDFIEWLTHNGSLRTVAIKHGLCSMIMNLKTCELLPKVKFILKTYNFDLSRYNSCSSTGIDQIPHHTILQHLCKVASSDVCLKVVPLLLEKGADINAAAMDSAGRTALQAACARKEEAKKLVEFLVHNKANVNAEPANKRGVTALQAAAI
jgi:ankyrin repeat protein